MKIIFMLFICLLILICSPAQASCDYSWQSAKDGSKCGERSAAKKKLKPPKPKPLKAPRKLVLDFGVDIV